MAHITLGDPVPVSLAPEGCRKWGQWQFPELSRLQDGSIGIEYNEGADSAGGFSHGRACSTDGGITWHKTVEFPAPNGCPLPDGGFLRPDPEHSYCRAEGIALPEPEISVLRDVVFNEFYRHDTFPPEFTVRRAERLEDGAWRKVSFPVLAPDEYIAVTRDDLAHHPFGSEGRWINLPRIDRFFPAPEGEIWAATYYNAYSETAERECLYPQYGCAFFVSSDGGRSFAFRSSIVYDDTFDPPRELRLPTFRRPEGFSEPAVAFTGKGEAVCLMRTDTHSACQIAYSADHGHTWTRPVIFDRYGVKPDLVRLGSGVFLCVYGRPGVRLRASGDPDARKWDEPVDVLSGAESSCSNCSLLPLSDDTALLAYSDFHWPDGKGGETKAILVRTVRVTV